jgi:hypothetical protein
MIRKPKATLSIEGHERSGCPAIGRYEIARVFSGEQCVDRTVRFLWDSMVGDEKAGLISMVKVVLITLCRLGRMGSSG